MKHITKLFKAIAALSMMFMLTSSAMATVIDPPVLFTDAGITITASETDGTVTVNWEVATPENLTSGFKVLFSETNALPAYPEDGTEYHYFDDNALRTDTITDLVAGKTYYIRIGQYNSDGTCTFYSNAQTLTISGTASEEPVVTPASTVEDAGIHLSVEAAQNGAKLMWTVDKPENLKDGFKVVFSKTNAEPKYPEEGSDYVYYSDNTYRSHTFTDLEVGATYYFRVCQYDGTCPFYSNMLSLVISGDATVEAVPTLYLDSPIPTLYTADPESFFNDTTNHWAKDYALKLKEKCGIKGYTDAEGDLIYQFKPDAPISRAELAKMLVECVGDAKTGLENSFDDVEGGSWYADAVLTAKFKGWVEGYDDGSFRPMNKVNRAEALKMILKIMYSDFTTDTASTFKDLDSSAWYYDIVRFAIAKNIVSGYADGTFRPGSDITRGEAAKIIVLVKGM